MCCSVLAVGPVPAGILKSLGVKLESVAVYLQCVAVNSICVAACCSVLQCVDIRNA